MHLAQHHFQLQRRYIEDSVAFARSSTAFAPWGVAALELDPEGLMNGSAALLRAAGVLPDGTTFDLAGDSLPAPIDVGSRFSPTQTTETLSLILPVYREGQANCALNGTPTDEPVRFRAWRRPMRDEVSGEDERDVTVAVPNFGLAMGEVDAGYVALPVARIRRDGSGAFVFDETYVPPLLQIGASPHLMSLGRRLVEILEARAGAGTRDAAASDDMTAVWLAHAVHSALAAIRLCVDRPATHPERLYVEMIRLAGALCTFSLNAHPRDLPAYRHDDLEAVFGDLDLHIRRHLEVAMPSAREVIALTARNASFSTGPVRDPRSLRQGQWFLGVRSQLPQVELANVVPKLVKICSAKHIERLVKEAFPGLVLRPTHSPPTGASPRSGFQYFLVEKTNPCWASIVDTGEVGLYTPDALGEATVELIAVWDADHG